MAIHHLFTPIGDTVNVSVSTTTARVAALDVTGQGGASHEVRLTNLGSATSFVVFGDSTVEATVEAGMPILPNTTEKFTVSAAHTHVAAITASGTATLYVTSGLGR